MVKILKKIVNFLTIIISIIITFILSAIYFILFFPFAVFIKICTDFLEVRQRPPFWIQHRKIEDAKEFLVQQ